MPVYLLLDCSESLAGEPIEAVRQGVRALLSDLKGDPMALETVYLGVITFASRAELAVPLTELIQFQEPKLRLGSGTALGAALRLLTTCLDRDLVKSSPTQKGDWKPMCVLITDGEPTDDWVSAADKVRTEICGKRANVIAIACGPDATPTLKRVTETVIGAADIQPDTLRAMFRWVSSSVSTTSHRLDGTGSALPPLPAGTVEVPATGSPRAVSDRYVFLHARCVKTKQFYIIRYEKRGRNYAAVASHQVDDFDFGPPGGADASAGPTVSVERLGPPPPCPVCQNPAVSFCECNRMFCSPIITRPMTLVCPWCSAPGNFAPMTSGFDVTRGHG